MDLADCAKFSQSLQLIRKLLKYLENQLLDFGTDINRKISFNNRFNTNTCKCGVVVVINCYLANIFNSATISRVLINSAKFRYNKTNNHFY